MLRTGCWPGLWPKQNCSQNWNERYLGVGSKKSRTTLNTCEGRPAYETRKTQSLQQVQLGKLNSYMQISKLEHTLTPHTKLNSWRLKDVNIRPYTTKTPRREHRQNILWHKSRQCFLQSLFQDNRNKSNNNERHIMKLIRICTRKETIKQKASIQNETIFANHATN